MLEEGNGNVKAFHLAGVVPVASPKMDFSFPWHDCLQPIADNYLAVERSIVECAYAGCETIWVVCNDDMQPLLRHRMGDYIEDPYYLNKSNFVKYPRDHRRQIPIFYTPIHPKDRDRRDSLAWSALHGALTAFIMSNKISKWIVPSRYYISFPYGVYQPTVIQKHRKRISSGRPFYLSAGGKTVGDGEYLGFTMDAEEYKVYLTNVKQNCTGGRKDLPPKERWSSRHFGLDKIFKSDRISKESKLEIDWYYRIDSWQGLKDYLASEESEEIKRPGKVMFKNSRYNKIGEQK
jgi:hypothetical protein